MHLILYAFFKCVTIDFKLLGVNLVKHDKQNMGIKVIHKIFPNPTPCPNFILYFGLSLKSP
jgi:hypothetical protein